MQLTVRDKGLLEIFRRHRFVAKSVLLRLFEGSESALHKWVKRCSAYVASESPFSGFTYYRLTATGARFLGVPEEAAKSPNVQGLQRAIGVLFFCFASEPPRWRYTRPDFSEDFPEVAQELHAEELYFLDFCLDVSDEVRLGEIVVDYGGDFQRLLQKLNGRLRRYIRTCKSLRELVEAGLFCFGIVVSNEEKRRAIEDAIERKPLKAFVRVLACSEIGDVLSGT